MPIHVPKHIQEIANYKPGKPNADMFEGKTNERSAILCSNENNFGTSPLALKAIQDAFSQLYLYPDPTGDALKAAIEQHYGYPKSRIVLGNGSDGILYTVFKAFFEPGDHILTSHGTFVSLRAMAKMNRVEYRTVPITPGYSFDLDAILAAINAQTRVIYLCNPNNPTGAMIPESDLVRFLQQVPEDRLVIVDEAYYEFSHSLSNEYPDSTRLGFNNVLTLRTFSKAYGLAGIRLGFGIAEESIIQVLHKVKLTFNPNLLAQAAGVAALKDEAFLSKTISNNKLEMAKFYALFERLGISYVPSFANFVMIDLKSEEKVETIYELLRGRGVLVRRLASFDLPHCMRVSIGRPEENDWFIACFEEAVQTLNS
jgi:histidinol-phosphate aminotransferase